MTPDPSADGVTDDELLERIAAGDAAAFTTLFRRRQPQVYRFALHMTGSPAMAEDVTQEVFLAVMREAAVTSRAVRVPWPGCAGLRGTTAWQRLAQRQAPC